MKQSRISNCIILLRKIHTITFVCLAFFALNTAFAEASNGASAASDNREAISNVIAQINHINWVVNTIKTYKNPIVLEVESEKVSNLYLDRIPDKAAMERIKQILVTLHNLRMDEREIKRWREDFEERRDREQKTFLIKASKQAVDAMTKQVQECCSRWSWESDPVGSAAAVLNAAFNVVHCPVSLYNDYDNFVYAQNKTARDKQFDFDTAKLNLLHRQNLEILEDQWKIINHYKLDDKLRVSDADIKMLLNCLRDEDSSRIYTRLAPMRERFSLFPEYWYYLSCVAMETGHFKEGIEACEKFFSVNRHIFRDDPMEGTVAFNKAFMLPKTDSNKQEVRRCLELASKNNVLRGDWKLDYLVAILYKGVFGEQGKSEALLERAIATIEQEMRKRTRYGGRACVTLDEGLFNCRNALHELRGEPLEEENEMVSLTRTQCVVIYDDECCPNISGVTNELISIRVPNDKHIHDCCKYTLQMLSRGKLRSSIGVKANDMVIDANMLLFEVNNSVCSHMDIDEYRLTFNDSKCPVIWIFRSIGHYYTSTELNQFGMEALELIKSQSLFTRFVVWATSDSDEFVNSFSKLLLEGLSLDVIPYAVSINGKLYYYTFTLNALMRMCDLDGDNGEESKDEIIANQARQFRAEMERVMNYETRYMELNDFMPYYKRFFKDTLQGVVRRQLIER